MLKELLCILYFNFILRTVEKEKYTCMYEYVIPMSLKYLKYFKDIGYWVAELNTDLYRVNENNEKHKQYFIKIRPICIL